MQAICSDVSPLSLRLWTLLGVTWPSSFTGVSSAPHIAPGEEREGGREGEKERVIEGGGREGEREERERRRE